MLGSVCESTLGGNVRVFRYVSRIFADRSIDHRMIDNLTVMIQTTLDLFHSFVTFIFQCLGDFYSTPGIALCRFGVALVASMSCVSR